MLILYGAKLQKLFVSWIFSFVYWFLGISNQENRKVRNSSKYILSGIELM
jgi:hypothetical protein